MACASKKLSLTKSQKDKKSPMCVCFLPTQKKIWVFQHNTHHEKGAGQEQYVRVYKKISHNAHPGRSKSYHQNTSAFRHRKKNAIFHSRPLHSRGFFVIKKIIKKLNKFNSFKEINIYSIIYVYKNIWTYKNWGPHYIHCASHLDLPKSYHNHTSAFQK